MPPKHSKLLRPPSKKAGNVAAASDKSRKRSRHMDPQPSTDGGGASSLNSDPQPQGFPPGDMDQLVARFALSLNPTQVINPLLYPVPCLRFH